ncbi:C-type lectin domain family 14 member A [Hypanus sabinus]|uniref:C-type lectin domain family 14 member A n=1 Tax=Hypanus sabinus TaxID=79690 RepID=UPI0028C451B1|nr:C-type lectin domain family 14 member A [Hypanus sabinus]
MLRSFFVLLWLQNYLERSGVLSQTQTFCNGGTCYSLHWDGGSFARAKERCEANKGVLTSMESEREAENIRQLLARNANASLQPHYLWIGLHLKVKQCYIAEQPLRGFTWISGNDSSTYNPWIEEPLQTCTHDRCVALVANFTTRVQLKWNALACNAKSCEGFICKYQLCESLSADVGTVAYSLPLHTRSQFFPRVPRDSAALITCSNGKSVAVRCGLQRGQIKWLYSGNLESLCNSCGEITKNDFCQNRCFRTAEEDFCFCDKGFSANLHLYRCVSEADLENSFNASYGTFLKVEIPVANPISPATSISAPTSSITLPGHADNSTTTFRSDVRGLESEARSNAPFLLYQVFIGVLALMLLVAVAVIIIMKRENKGAQEKQLQAFRMEIKNADSALREDENAPENTTINITNENHYMETPPASEKEFNLPKENGEISVSVAQ